MRKNFMFLFLAAFLCLGGFLISKPAQAIDMKEGLWEINMEMKMEGIPGAPTMPFTTKQCLTQKDLVPQSSEKKDNCKVLDQKIIGNKVIWKARCTERGSVMESEGEITYTGAAYSGTQKTKITEKSGEVMNSVTKMKGRRVGDCK
jgi:hypothetical protein